MYSIRCKLLNIPGSILVILLLCKLIIPKDVTLLNISWFILVILFDVRLISYNIGKLLIKNKIMVLYI